MFANITTMAASFGHDKLAITLLIRGTIASFISGLTFGTVSDLTVKYMSRVSHIFMDNSLQTLFFILSIFWGDTSRIFTALVMTVYINNGCLFAVIPALLSEYFGSHHFMRNWGAETFLTSLLSLVLGVTVRSFYQNAILNEDTECSGPVFYLCLRTVLDSKNLISLLAKIISFSVSVLTTRS